MPLPMATRCVAVGFQLFCLREKDLILLLVFQGINLEAFSFMDL